MAIFGFIRRIGLALLFVGCGAAAIGWWWLMPGGFPFGHIRFWTNQVLPIVPAVVAGVGIRALFRDRSSVATACAWAFGIAMLSTTLTARLIYSDFMPEVATFGFVAGLTALTLAFFGASGARRPVVLGLATVPSIVCGAYMPWAMRSATPSTTPLLQDQPTFEDFLTDGRPAQMPVRELPAGGDAFVSKRTSVYYANESVEIDLGPVDLSVQPLLTFESTSADGGWTIFSRSKREMSPRFGRLKRGFVSDDFEPFLYSEDVRLRVADRKSIEIESLVKVAKPIYSHLNTFCVLKIQADDGVELEFSPCGSARFEPKQADYPIGRPARFAYCDAGRTFHVVEATSGEKGPFKELGSGPLEHGARLSIGVVNQGKLAAKIHFHDWSSQLSTALSPTAGWGVAANAIEFQATPRGGRILVMIWLTLAGTSVGRGFDTVGHSPGAYRNHITIEPSTSSPASPP